jgi:hypothetical protein
MRLPAIGRGEQRPQREPQDLAGEVRVSVRSLPPHLDDREVENICDRVVPTALEMIDERGRRRMDLETSVPLADLSVQSNRSLATNAGCQVGANRIPLAHGASPHVGNDVLLYPRPGSPPPRDAAKLLVGSSPAQRPSPCKDFLVRSSRIQEVRGLQTVFPKQVPATKRARGGNRAAPRPNADVHAMVPVGHGQAGSQFVLESAYVARARGTGPMTWAPSHPHGPGGERFCSPSVLSFELLPSLTAPA